MAEPLRAVLGFGESTTHFDQTTEEVWSIEEGEDLSLILQEDVGIDSEAAIALGDALIEADPVDPRDGDEPFFQKDRNYQHFEVSAARFAETWNRFADRVKHRRRFFDSAARDQLAELLGEPGSPEVAALPVTVIGTGRAHEHVYRARRALTEEEARRFLGAPDTELSPPPPAVASAGRMNPAGISVFYGAASHNVAVAEIRPSVGGYVVLGAFTPTRELRLLDLTRMGGPLTGSIFAPGYVERAERNRFLQSFHSLITRPVQPHEQVLEYLPTQAVAEYVRNVLAFDGILFASTQTGSRGKRSVSSSTTPRSRRSGAFNLVVFGEERDDHTYTLGFRDTSRIAESMFPLSYERESARCVQVSQVSYEFATIQRSLERLPALADDDPLPF